MGFVTIQTVFGDGKDFRFEIKSDGLYDINCLPRTKHITSLDKIFEICITKDMIVTRTEDRDLRNGWRPGIPYVKDELRENTINAYDLDGNHLWNIGDLVGDIKISFTNFMYVTDKYVEERFNITLPDHSDTLFECIADAFVFIVDGINRKLLYKGGNMR